MLFSMKIRRECMIDQDYWKKIASKWATESDGIEIPEVEATPMISAWMMKSSGVLLTNWMIFWRISKYKADRGRMI